MSCHEACNSLQNNKNEHHYNDNKNGTNKKTTYCMRTTSLQDSSKHCNVFLHFIFEIIL